MKIAMNLLKIEPMLATPLIQEHTLSCGYRFWIRELENPQNLLFRKTHWGPHKEMVDYIMLVGAVRIDHWMIESQSWVTIWLASIEYVSLQGGHND